MNQKTGNGKTGNGTQWLGISHLAAAIVAAHCARGGLLSSAWSQLCTATTPLQFHVLWRRLSHQHCSYVVLCAPPCNCKHAQISHGKDKFVSLSADHLIAL
jgi:hypothetical protein